MSAADRERVTRHGSTVHVGGYECECFGCALGEPSSVARWTCWRLVARNAAMLDNGHVWRVSATWTMCDECRAESERIGPARTGPLYTQHELYLPLLHPSDPYARIAVEEMLYALAALTMPVRRDSHPLCGFDVYGFGKPTKAPCRARATQLVEEWVGDEGGDLYLCEKHAKTLKRRERDGGGVLEMDRVLDFGGGR